MKNMFLLIILLILTLFLVGCTNNKESSEKNEIFTEEGYTFREIGREYDSVSGTSPLSVVEEKLVFIAKKDDTELVVFDEKASKPYNHITGNIKVINGKVTYLAYNNLKKLGGILISGEEEIAKNVLEFIEVDGKLGYVAGGDTWFVFLDGVNLEKKYYSNLVVVGDKLAYITLIKHTNDEFTKYVQSKSATSGTDVRGEQRVIFFDGNILGKEYYAVHLPTNINGKLAFIGERGEKMFVVFDGVEEPYSGYSGEIDSNKLINIGGKLAYVVTSSLQKEGKWVESQYLVFDGKEGKHYETSIISPDYDHPTIINPFQIIEFNGKPAYVATTSAPDGNCKSYVVYDDIEHNLDAGGRCVVKVANIGGELAYVLGGPGNMESVVFKGKTEKWYSEVYSLTNINGKLAYIAKDKYGKFLVVFDGVEGKYYDSIPYGSGFDLVNINGKLGYVAGEYINKGNSIGYWKYFIVYDEKELGKKYISANGLVEIDGKLAYTATVKDNKQIIVIEE